MANLIKSLFPSGSFSRGVAVLAGGNSIGQFITLLFAPVLTRLFTPSDFGLLAIYMSITTIFSVIVCMRYEMAIPLPESESEAADIALLALFSTFLMSSVCFFIVIYFGESLAEWIGEEVLARYLFLVPVSLFLLGVFSVLSYQYGRKKNYALLARVRIYQVIFTVCVQLGFSALGAIALIMGQLVSQFVGCVFLAYGAVSSIIEKASVAGAFHAMVRYRRFPLVSMWSAVTNRFSSQLPTLFFAILFGPALAGLYALAIRVVNSPSGILSKALHFVFLNSVASAYKNGAAGVLAVKTFRKLTILVVPPLMFFGIVAPDVFGLVFGATWVGAGEFARWNVFLVFGALAVAPLMVLYSVAERQSDELALQASLLIGRVAALGLGWYLQSPLLAIFLYNVASALAYLWFLHWLVQLLEINHRDMFSPLLYSLLWSVIVCLPVLLTYVFSEKSWFFYTVPLSIAFLMMFLFFVLKRS